MHREAVALGTPVFTTFEESARRVDEALFREGRLRKLENPEQVTVVKRRTGASERIRGDPRELVSLLPSARDT